MEKYTNVSEEEIVPVTEPTEETEEEVAEVSEEEPREDEIQTE